MKTKVKVNLKRRMVSTIRSLALSGRWIPDPRSRGKRWSHDHKSVAIDFIRGLKNGTPQNFSLRVTIGEGVYEGQPIGPQYRMELNSEWNYPDLEGMSVENTIRLFKDDKLSYSRQFYMEQTNKVSQVFF